MPDWYITPQERRELRAEEIQEELEPCVEEGVRWFNSYFQGTSWVWDIDLPTFDMGSCFACAFGQLFGEYDNIQEFGIDPADYGFSADNAGVRSFDEEDESYAILTNIWVEAITDIREGKDWLNR